MPSKNYSKKLQKRSRRNPGLPKVLVPRGLSARELEITRMCETYVTVTSGSTGTYGINGTNSNSLSFSFTLQGINIYIGGTSNAVGLPNYTQFTSLFDQYCIKKVEMLAFYNVNTSTNTGGAVSTASLPVFALVDDYTDAGILTSMSDAMSYGSCKLIQFGNDRSANPGIRHALSPRLAVGAGDYGAIAAPIVPKGPIWLNTQNVDIPHYGIKMYYDNWTTGTATQQGELQIFFKYTFGFKQPK